MKLQVSQLHEGENRLEYSADKNEPIRKLVERLKLAGHPIDGNLKAVLQLTKLEPNYYLRGRLQYNLKPLCSRCADTFPYPVDHAFELGLVHLANGKPQRTATLAEESEELDLNWFSDHELNLEPILEEQFNLSLPFQPLCSPDCRGICQNCGKDLNEGACGCGTTKADNPFSVLKNLKV